MDSSLKTKAAYVVFSLFASSLCIYCMVEPLASQSNSLMRQQLQSSTPGPFDEAFAQTLGGNDYTNYLKRSREYSPKFWNAEQQGWSSGELPSFDFGRDDFTIR
jgi:hypothetical protein